MSIPDTNKVDYFTRQSTVILDKKINVLAVDDHTLFRRGTVMMLKSFSEVNDVYEASNGKEALEVLNAKEIDVVLLDLEMPVMDGWEAAHKILTKHSGIYVIMISMHDSLEVISELIELGVHSYLLKNAEPEDVRKAIQSIQTNTFYYNQLVAQALMKKVQIGSIQKPVFKEKTDLTKREVEILQLICKELTMKEIGDILFLSEQTVHTHRKNLMKKTKVKNAVGLVKYAIQHNIVTI